MIYWKIGKRRIGLMKRTGKESYYIIVPKWWAESLKKAGIEYVEVKIEENGVLVAIPLSIIQPAETNENRGIRLGMMHP